MKRRVKKPERYGEWEEKIDFRGEKKENAVIKLDILYPFKIS